MILSDFPLNPAPAALSAVLTAIPTRRAALSQATASRTEAPASPRDLAQAAATPTSAAQEGATQVVLACTLNQSGNSKQLVFDHESSRDPLIERLFGRVVSSAFNEPEITEIMLNDSGELMVEHKQYGMCHLGTMSAAAAQNAMRALATLLGQDLSSVCPILSGDISAHNARFEGLLPPLVSAPVFAIRRHQDQSHTLEDLLALGTLTPVQAQILRSALEQHLSLLVAGATGSGKTTLVDTLLNELSLNLPQERVISIEDTKELSSLPGNYVHLVGNGKVELSTLLRSALRLRPDRIVVGEVRGPEALDLVDALTTGHHGGLATIHAGSPEQALQRLTLLVSRNPSCPRQIEPMVASAIDLIVQTERVDLKRQVTDIAVCAGFQNGHFALIPVTTDLAAALEQRRSHERRVA